MVARAWKYRCDENKRAIDKRVTQPAVNNAIVPLSFLLEMNVLRLRRDNCTYLLQAIALAIS
jgi:hypothetical protein